MPTDHKKSFGQYFTPPDIAELMVQLILHDPARAAVLEPSAGDGVFVDALKKHAFENVTACELDPTVIPEQHQNLYRQGSFVTEPFADRFDVVIGNPPYVRWKNMTSAQQQELAADALWQREFNSLCDLLFLFIARSVDLLNDGGELIFITPAFWSSTMHASSVRRYLHSRGALDLWVQFGEAQVFPGVGSSILIFRFTKGAVPQPVTVFEYVGPRKLALPQPSTPELLRDPALFRSYESAPQTTDEPWVWAPAETQQQLNELEAACRQQGTVKRLGDVATIANGMVSGLDRAFRVPEQTTAAELARWHDLIIPVIKARDLGYLQPQGLSHYFLLEHLDEEELGRYPEVRDHLQPFRIQLENRYDYGRGTRYWQWSLLRSRAFFEEPGPLVFIPCKERITNKVRLRLAVAPEGAYPTQDITAFRLDVSVREKPEYFVGLFSSSFWFQWVQYKGLLKGGVAEFSEKPLSQLPVRLINWENTREQELYTGIVKLVKQGDGRAEALTQLDELVRTLIHCAG